MLTLDALKNLYVAAGGDAAAVADMSTNVEVLNAISDLLGGAGESILIPDAVAEIAENYSGGGGGGGSELSFAHLEFESSVDTSANTFQFAYLNRPMYPVSIPGNSYSGNVILYQGKANVLCRIAEGTTVITEGAVTELSPGSNIYVITGDCSIKYESE